MVQPRGEYTIVERRVRLARLNGEPARRERLVRRRRAPAESGFKGLSEARWTRGASSHSRCLTGRHNVFRGWPKIWGCAAPQLRCKSGDANLKMSGPCRNSEEAPRSTVLPRRCSVLMQLGCQSSVGADDGSGRPDFTQNDELVTLVRAASRHTCVTPAEAYPC